MKKSIGLLLILSCMTSAVAQENPDSSDDQMAQTEPVESDTEKADKQTSDAQLKASARKAANYSPMKKVLVGDSEYFFVDI